MKLDIKVDLEDECYQVAFETSQAQTLKELKQILAIVRALSAYHELDPELGLEDLEEIVDKTQELNKEIFTFIIGPEEIEVDI